MQTDPIALGRAEAARLIRDETGVWMMAGEMWTSAARHIVCRVMTSLGLDQHDYRQRDKGIMAIADTLNAMLDEACRAADGYGALERERDELLARVERMKLSLLEIQAIEGEINPSNYDHEGVCFLNSAFIKAGTIADDALSLEKDAATPADPERKD